MQIYLLNARFQQHQQIIWTGKGGVQDRTIYEDSVFAKVWTLSHCTLSVMVSFRARANFVLFSRC